MGSDHRLENKQLEKTAATKADEKNGIRTKRATRGEDLDTNDTRSKDSDNGSILHMVLRKLDFQGTI